MTGRTPAVVGAPGALTERLAAAVRAAATGCRQVEPSVPGLAALAAGDGAGTWVYAALAGVGLDGTPDLEAAARVFSRAREAGVRHLVLVASAAVHEPGFRHPGHVSEGRLAPLRLGNAVARAWRGLEELARESFAGSGAALTVLRPPAVLTPGGGDYFSRLLAARLACLPPGFDPPLQLLAVDDLAAGVVRAVERGREAAGVYHLAPAAVMPLGKALRAARCRRLAVPLGLQRPIRRLLGRRAAPIDQLEYVRHPWTVSAGEARRRLGFEPRHTSAAAVRRSSPRARAAGDERFDDFGLDAAHAARLGRTLFRFLHDVWWRVEWRGLEHVPRTGRAVLVGLHRGHQPWDGLMTFHLLARELGRHPRFLIHPTLVRFPFLAPLMMKCGGVPACRENAARVLEGEGLLAIYPEGVRGAFAMARDGYELGRFGRDEYVKIALRHRAPIVPYVTVGPAETFPILARVDWKWWRQVSGWPFLPITPTMSTVPLPSKWHTRFLEPIPVAETPPEAAGDPQTVKAISRRVQGRMAAAIAEMLERRRSIWWGSVFDGEPPACG